MAKQFVEVILAPSFNVDALNVFKAKQNVRVLQIPLARDLNIFDMKRVGGGLLLQTADDFDVAELRVVTKRKPSAACQ